MEVTYDTTCTLTYSLFLHLPYAFTLPIFFKIAAAGSSQGVKHLIIHQWMVVYIQFHMSSHVNFVRASEKCVFSSECGVYSRYKHTYESTPLHFVSFRKIEQPNVHMQTHI